jgi:hypothetical protein
VIGQAPTFRNPSISWLGVAGLSAFLLTFLAGSLILAFSIGERSAIPLLAFVVFGAVGGGIAASMGRTALTLYSITFATNAIVVVGIYLLYLQRYGTPYYMGGSDDLAYELWGKDAIVLALFNYGGLRGGILSESHNSVAYVYLIGLFYRIGDLLGGFHTTLPRLFNSLGLGLMAALTYRLARNVGLRQITAIATGAVVGLLPIMQYTAAHTFRDILTSLLTLTVVYIWSRPASTTGRISSRLARWLVTSVAFILLADLRRFQAYAVLGIAFIADFASFRKLSAKRKLLYGLLALIALAVGLILFTGELLSTVERLSRLQTIYVTGLEVQSEGGLSNVIFATPPPLGYGLRIAYALVQPLPVLTGEIERLLLSIGTLIQFFFLPFLALGILTCFRDRTKWPLLVAFLILFGGMAFVTFTYRHVVLVLPYAAVITAIGFTENKKYALPVWLLMIGSGMLAAVLYLWVRA